MFFNIKRQHPHYNKPMNYGITHEYCGKYHILEYWYSQSILSNDKCH